MKDLSFGLQEHLHWLAAYLARHVELNGQQGDNQTPAEFFLELLYKFHRDDK
jgi:hypothetical protein